MKLSAHKIRAILTGGLLGSLFALWCNFGRLEIRVVYYADSYHTIEYKDWLFWHRLTEPRILGVAYASNRRDSPYLADFESAKALAQKLNRQAIDSLNTVAGEKWKRFELEQKEWDKIKDKSYRFYPK